MIIDSHYHLNTTLLPTEELLKKMEDAGVDKIALMANPCGPVPVVSEMLLKLNRFFLTHGAFRGLARKLMNKFTPEGGVYVLKNVIKIFKDPDNQSVFDAVKAHPTKFLGWIFVNPRGERDQLQEFHKWKDVPGAIGVKAHPFWHQITPIELLPVAQELVKLGKPLLVHLGFNEKGNFDALLKEVPDLKLVMAHAGFPCYSQTWKAIKNKPNVYVDLSQTLYVNASTTRKVVNALGPDRCFFGSDGPWGSIGPRGEFDLGLIKRRIEKLFPDARIRAKLLGESFQKIIEK